MGAVDEPRPAANVSGNIAIVGWAASEDSVSKACLYVDRQFTSCTENISGLRPDVAKVLPNIAGADTSGWAIQVGLTPISVGSHEFVVQATSKAGSTRRIVDMVVNVVR
jgi:hypothetical protein